MIDNHFQIGEVADKVGLSLRTIRYYEEIGLISPSGRTEGGFRLYTDSDVERLRLVTVLKPVGMSLEAMSEILGCVDTIHAGTRSGASDAAPRLDKALAMARERCDLMQKQLDAACQKLNELQSLTKGSIK